MGWFKGNGTPLSLLLCLVAATPCCAAESGKPGKPVSADWVVGDWVVRSQQFGDLALRFDSGANQPLSVWEWPGSYKVSFRYATRGPGIVRIWPAVGAYGTFVTEFPESSWVEFRREGNALVLLYPDRMMEVLHARSRGAPLGDLGDFLRSRPMYYRSPAAGGYPLAPLGSKKLVDTWTLMDPRSGSASTDEQAFTFEFLADSTCVATVHDRSKGTKVHLGSYVLIDEYHVRLKVGGDPPPDPGLEGVAYVHGDSLELTMSGERNPLVFLRGPWELHAVDADSLRRAQPPPYTGRRR